MPRKKIDKQEETILEAPTAVEGELIEPESEQAGESDSQAAELQAKLDQVQAKADEYLDGWQRSMAEFSNYKKRIEREQTLNQQMAKANVIRRFLDLFDDLDRAIKNRPQSGDGANWSEGIELINRKFQNYLQSEGVEIVETEGQFFDPNLHEAISQEDNPELESGQIIGVVQQGYRIGDRVLRPARVRVAR